MRVMWLLNHTTLRGFEVEMLRSLGINEIFMPKSFPYDEGNLSASVTAEYDKNITIPAKELAILNEQNWYETPSYEAWCIANQYFDIAFIAFFPKQIASTVKHFKGQIVLRVFGLSKGVSYTELLKSFLTRRQWHELHDLKKRFWFGAAYEHLDKIEGRYIKQRTCFLPIGLKGDLETGSWQGGEKKIFFVCPRIGTSSYYHNIYKKFKTDFEEFAHVIGGAQPIAVNDKNVIGYVPKEVHQKNMYELRVMFYHSTEPNHVHYHPFEAVKQGMPLIFMAGGLLDSIGGSTLPGRCKTIEEAKVKIKRIMNDDWEFINLIRDTQTILFDAMRVSNCVEPWRVGFNNILSNLDVCRKESKIVEEKRSKIKRIAVIIPVEYKGGSLRGAKLVAEAIYLGALQEKEVNVEVILGHLDLPNDYYSDEDFADMPAVIKRRPYKWRLISNEVANGAVTFSRLDYTLDEPFYQVPDDGISFFSDCDLLVYISDRIEYPLLPLTPYIMVVYDYIQRYENILPAYYNNCYFNAAKNAEKVIVTTEFTKRDALQFAGLNESKILKCPMLVPNFYADNIKNEDPKSDYFLWTTNLAPHKNHENAIKALSIYYQQLNGQLKCYVTGVNSEKILTENKLDHLKNISKILDGNQQFRKNVVFHGSLSDLDYKKMLAKSTFLWHPARVDNGTFSVIEAACLNVPSLSSDYPPMQEINNNFKLNISWMDPWDPMDMAKKLKHMEINAEKIRTTLLTQHNIMDNHIKKAAMFYWNVVKEAL